MPSDITELILAHHNWFREQFARLDDAAAASDVDALRALWDPLATKLDLHAVAEEQIFYPQLLRRGTEDPREATLDAIGDHNDIRDGVHAAEAAVIGTPSWWAAVAQTREANDEHMAEEEREGLADFRRNAPVGLREALGQQFTRFFEQHETTEAVNVSDKDPQRYVDDVERAIATGRPSDGSLGIGSLKGRPHP
jgi:hemerythrin HHE cation binding domain-containing protein